MRDRIPRYPNRRRIIPEDGGTPFYATVERADDPIEPGTPLNKATLLTDRTASNLGIDPETATVDIALSSIKSNTFMSRLSGGIF